MRQESERKRARSANNGARVLYFAALGLTVFEGAIRKWCIGSEAGLWSYLVYFSKDLVFAAILLWPAQPASSQAVEIFGTWFIPGGALFLFGGVLSSLRDFNPVGALLTVRAGLILPTLALLTAKRMSGIGLLGIARLLVFCTMLNCGLGIVQTRLSPDHILNRYVLTDSPVSAVETAVRATGTFSYISGLGIMSSVGIWAGMVLLAMAQTRWEQALALGGIVAGFGCGLSSVSRGPIICGCVMLLAWGLWSRAGFRVLSKSAVIWVPALLVLCSGGTLPRFKELGRAIIARHESGEDTLAQRVFGQLEEGCAAAARSPFGAGLGTEQIGGNYAVSGTMRFTNYETQLPRLIAETGVAGLGGYVTISMGVLLALQQARRTVQTTGMNAAVLATELLFVPILYANVLFNHIASAFLWMIFSGVLAMATDFAGPCMETLSKRRPGAHEPTHIANKN